MQMPTTDNDPLFKVLLIGDSGVGKTCLLTRFTNGIFNESFKPTIGVEFITKSIAIDEQTLRLQIWDTSGQGRYRAISSAYYRGAHGIIMVFDVTKAESFENISRWLKEIDQDASENVKKLLVGNKCDLISNRVVDSAVAQKFADSLNIPYVETSSMNSTNVEQAFETLATDIISVVAQAGRKVSPVNHHLETKPLQSAIITKSESDDLLKLCLIGESGAGKSSLLLRFVNNAFNESFIPTIGVEFGCRTIQQHGKTVLLQLRDTAGQERFRTITKRYYRGVHGIMLVFDLTNIKSFENIKMWLEDINQHVSDSVKKLLVGNKCDLTLKRALDHVVAQKFADSLNIPYVETSSKNSTNVEQAFNNLVSEILSTV